MTLTITSRPPSRVLNTTLPLNPSVTTTSTASVATSWPSMFPMKLHAGERRRGGGAPPSRSCCPSTPPRRSTAARRVGWPPRSAARENTVPICANCTNHSGWHSAFAPASSSTVGVSPGTGNGAAIAGRDTPRMRPMRSNALAIVAPVLPALTIAEALPSRTASAARTSDESFFRRTPCAPSSSIAMISAARRCTGTPRQRRPPQDRRGERGCRARRRPHAHRRGLLQERGHRRRRRRRSAARGLSGSPRASVDVDGLAALVPPAGAAHVVRHASRHRNGGTCCVPGR